MSSKRYNERAEVEVYAKTLLDAVRDSGIDEISEIRSQLNTIVEYNLTHVELLNSLRGDAYTPEQRVTLMESAFAGVNPKLGAVLRVMAERDDLRELLIKVRTGFEGRVTRILGISFVDVVTRVPLDDHLREVIKNKAAEGLGGTIVLNEKVDPDMLGGIIMSANGQRIDASVNTMLEAARRTLKEN